MTTESTAGCVTEVDITDEVNAREAHFLSGFLSGTEIEIDPENSEMIIVGDSVSLGYYKDKERTDKVFHGWRSPLVKSYDMVRAYRTGDTGHYDVRHAILRWRTDHQAVAWV